MFSTISFFIRSCAASLPGEMIPKAMEIADKADNILMETGHKIIPLITNAIIKSANSYAVFGNEYSEAHPVEGATQCIDTLRSNPNILEETTTHWNFNPSSNIQYQMLIHTIKT